MGELLAVILTLVLTITGILVLFYFMSFIKLYKRTKNIWAEIERQLKYRYGLVSNLIEKISSNRHQKSDDAEKLSQAYKKWSSANSMAEKTRAEEKLNDVLKPLVDKLTPKPGVEVNDDLTELLEELDRNEMKLVYAQMFYNDQVRKYLRNRRAFLRRMAACILRLRDPETFDVDNYSRKVQTDLTF